MKLADRARRLWWQSRDEDRLKKTRNKKRRKEKEKERTMKFVELTKITASGTEKFILNADLIQKVYVKDGETFINVKDTKAELIAESYKEMKSILQANSVEWLNKLDKLSEDILRATEKAAAECLQPEMSKKWTDKSALII